MTENTCLWWATAPEPKKYLNKPLPQTTDIVVIGGGFTGTSAALQLAKHGAKVTLLEAKSIGYEASSRNGGQALSCLHNTMVRMVKIHGRERAKEMFLAATRAADTVEQIVREENIDCDHVRNGNIEAASKPIHFDEFKQEQELLHELVNYEVQIIPKSEMRSELGTDSYFGAMVNPRSGAVQPAKFVRGMGDAAAKYGADIHEGTPVESIERVENASHNGIRFKIRTKRGDILAKEIMVATNAWMGKLVPQFNQHVFPVDSFIIATEPLPGEVTQKLITRNRVAYDTKNMLAYYRLSPDNRMVWGGEATYNGASPQRNINALKKGMCKVFPELAKFKIDYYWSGTIGITLDENTHAGQADGMWYSMCYVGHGVTLATYMGRQMANGILGKPSDNPFANIHIPRVPLFRDKAWFINSGKLLKQLEDLVS